MRRKVLIGCLGALLGIGCVHSRCLVYFETRGEVERVAVFRGYETPEQIRELKTLMLSMGFSADVVIEREDP